MPAPISITEQLQAFSAGDRQAAEAALREIFPQLRQMAVQRLRKERYAEPISPTELINEVWLTHIQKGGWRIRSREHFYAVVSCAMRQVLIDFARRRLALKRGGLDGAMPLHEARGPMDDGSAQQIVEIGLLMEKLAQAHPRSLPIVYLHYFAGFSFEEIAAITGQRERQVRHLWVKGRDWLRERMKPPSDRAQGAAQTASPSGDGARDRTRARSRAVQPIPRTAG